MSVSIRAVFVVETSEGDDFAKKRTFTVEIVHFGAFSVASGSGMSKHRSGVNHKSPLMFCKVAAVSM